MVDRTFAGIVNPAIAKPPPAGPAAASAAGSSRAELESLVEMSETTSLMRAKALRFLERKP